MTPPMASLHPTLFSPFGDEWDGWLTCRLLKALWKV